MLFAVAILAVPLPFDAYAETWMPVDKTAISITGKVTFTPSKITFQNGKSLAIKAATDAGIDGQVFKVLKPADPQLIRGNTLCGRSTVKYILIVKPDRKSRGLSVYDGPNVPFQDTPSCASYSYEVGPE